MSDKSFMRRQPAPEAGKSAALAWWRRFLHDEALEREFDPDDLSTLSSTDSHALAETMAELNKKHRCRQ